jgi:hypothetical protein
MYVRIFEVFGFRLRFCVNFCQKTSYRINMIIIRRIKSLYEDFVMFFGKETITVRHKNLRNLPWCSVLKAKADTTAQACIWDWRGNHFKRNILERRHFENFAVDVGIASGGSLGNRLNLHSFVYRRCCHWQIFDFCHQSGSYNSKICNIFMSVTRQDRTIVTCRYETKITTRFSYYFLFSIREILQ